MPIVSIEISVSPLREEIALTCGPPAAPTAEISVPGASGRSVQRTWRGMPWRRSGGI
jgi:hypothetical protein